MQIVSVERLRFWTQPNTCCRQMLITHAADLLCLQLHTVRSFLLLFVSTDTPLFGLRILPSLWTRQSLFGILTVQFHPTVPSVAICRQCRGNNSWTLSSSSDVISLCFLFLASLRRKWRHLVCKTGVGYPSRKFQFCVSQCKPNTEVALNVIWRLFVY